jgi:hypothetical protein
MRHRIIFDGSERYHQKSHDQSPVLSFSSTPSDSFSKAEIKAASLPVPAVVKLYLKPLAAGDYILRLHHTNEFGSAVDVDMTWSASKELTLAANQERSNWEDKRLRFKAEANPAYDMAKLQRQLRAAFTNV